jgi:glycerol-3-phosphate acyltransferase PlsY
VVAFADVSPTPLVIAGALVVAYLAGSIPFGLLVARARGVDVRHVGSGNIGATNVARTLGKKTGALVLFLDAVKGLLPVLGARLLWPDRPELAAAVGLTAILGHVFPVWLKLHGGKGVATGLGVFLALSPISTAIAAVFFFVVYSTKRIVSIGSIAAATVLPIAMLVRQEPRAHVALAVAVWLLVLVRHQANIRRLLRREERKL